MDGLTLGSTDEFVIGDELGLELGDVGGLADGIMLGVERGDVLGLKLGAFGRLAVGDWVGDALGGEVVVSEIEGLALALIDDIVGGVVGLALTTLNEEANTPLMTVPPRPFFWIVPVRLPSTLIVTSVEFVSAKIVSEHASQGEDTIISTKSRVVFSDCNLREGPV